MGVTMVACYGAKSPALTRFIETAQSRLGESIASFVPYDTRQVHATLIGLEGRRCLDGAGVLNANYLALREVRRVMDLGRALDLARHAFRPPLRIQIGGFVPGARAPFLSRGRSPYERSFSMSEGRAVAMGWPHVDGAHPAPLARLRREFESVGVLHKYHRGVEDRDDDFFFVLGRARSGDPGEPELRAAAEDLRASMLRAPFELVLDLRDIHVVGYVDPALPVETSVRYDLSDLDAASLVGLYPDAE
jgi:hypothetical protein